MKFEAMKIEIKLNSYEKENEEGFPLMVEIAKYH